MVTGGGKDPPPEFFTYIAITCPKRTGIFTERRGDKLRNSERKEGRES
jgi:hypothetical protein